MQSFLFNLCRQLKLATGSGKHSECETNRAYIVRSRASFIPFTGIRECESLRVRSYIYNIKVSNWSYNPLQHGAVAPSLFNVILTIIFLLFFRDPMGPVRLLLHCGKKERERGQRPLRKSISSCTERKISRKYVVDDELLSFSVKLARHEIAFLFSFGADVLSAE